MNISEYCDVADGSLTGREKSSNVYFGRGDEEEILSNRIYWEFHTLICVQ